MVDEGEESAAAVGQEEAEQEEKGTPPPRTSTHTSRALQTPPAAPSNCVIRAARVQQSLHCQ
jgi:hypothetical protein